jgi:hypothetical protein
MNNKDSAVCISDASHPLGSVSVLSFLTEASREEAYRDPLEAMYGTEPTVTEQPLSEVYTVDSVNKDLIQVEKRNTEFSIAKSFDLNFARLVGAAYVMASYSTIPDFDLRGGQHAAYQRKHSSIPLTPQQDVLKQTPQEVLAIFDFWSAFDPHFDLVRELKVSISMEVARELIDFGMVADAMETGELTSRVESAERITPKLAALEEIGAISEPDGLDYLLKQLCGPFGTHSELRSDIRLQFRENALHAKLTPYGVANPLLETFLSKLFGLTPDACNNGADQTWYLPGDASIYDLYLPNDDQLMQFATNDLNIVDKMIGRTGADIISELPDERIPISPSLILAGACYSQKALNFSYAEIATVAGIISGSEVWGDVSEIINEISVVYDTPGKIARRRYCHFDEEADYQSDEYVTERLPVDVETATQLVVVADLSETESARDVGSIRPGIAQEDLRVGAGYLSVVLTEPAKLLCEYMLSARLEGDQTA